MANTKNEMTQSKALGVVLAKVEAEEITLPADVVAKLTEIKTSIDTKSEKRKAKAKEVKEEDKEALAVIEAYMSDGQKYLVGDVVKGTGLTISTSKATTLIKSIDGVQNVKEGKKSLYFIA